MSTAAVMHYEDTNDWKQPSRGMVGMACLITAESAIFIIFVVAYIFYVGKSLSGPTPRQVLDIPIFATICLLSSSITVHFAVHALRHSRVGRCAAWLAGTVLLGGIFIACVIGFPRGILGTVITAMTARNNGVKYDEAEAPEAEPAGISA